MEKKQENLVGKKAKTDYFSFAISLTRIFSTPFVVYVIMTNPQGLYTGIFFLIFALSDTADGAVRIIAKKLGYDTRLGKAFDPIADRIFFTSVIAAIVLKYEILSHTYIYNSILLILSREVMTLPHFIQMYLKERKAKKINIREVAQKTPIVSKATTTLQAIAIVGFLFGVSFVNWLIWITFVSGIISGLKYLKRDHI